MTPDEVADFLATLPGCKRKGTAAVPAWYVDDRIVARLVASDELMIRCAFDARERLVTEYPETFGIPPSYEAHLKVQAMLYGDSGAIREALREAWELQRRRGNGYGQLTERSTERPTGVRIRGQSVVLSVRRYSSRSTGGGA